MTFDAIDGQKVRHPPSFQATPPAGSWGCFRSHYRILEDALNNDLSSILVFEDDVLFVENFAARVDQFLRALPDDWEWIYLGGKHIQRNQGLPFPINPEVYRPFNVHGCFAYGFRGREAIERVYRHINSPEDWLDRHCIDHRFGEMHRSYPGGVYVPAQWLVGHRAGPSTIRSGIAKEEFFRDANWLCNAPLDRRMHVVTGQDSNAAQMVAEALHYLGVSFGEGTLEQDDVPGVNFGERVSPGLQQLMRNLVDSSWWKPLTDYSHRVAMLRQWASRRCHLNRNRDGRPLGAYHDAFASLGNELCEAWDQPVVIIVHDAGASQSRHPPATGPDIVRTRCARHGLERFDELPFDKLLHLHLDRFQSGTDVCVWLCTELSLSPSPDTYHRATALIDLHFQRRASETQR
jgi:hypothetical protein